MEISLVKWQHAGRDILCGIGGGISVRGPCVTKDGEVGEIVVALSSSIGQRTDPYVG